MIDKIFSLKNEDTHHVLTILGMKLKWKKHWKRRILEELLFYAHRDNPSKKSKNIRQDLKLYMSKLAAEDSARFIMKNCLTAPTFNDRLDLLTYSLSKVKVDGMFMEFGVFSGKTINHIAKHRKNDIIYGFDSFEGLPETWQSTYEKGHFKVDSLPKVEDNVKLIKGWFDDTLPKFVQENGDFKIAFLHNDSDLYSSTKTTFDYLKNHFQSGTIIQFDEYLNYPGWEENEYKAFMEFIEETGYKYEYLGYVADAKHMAVRIYK